MDSRPGRRTCEPPLRPAWSAPALRFPARAAPRAPRCGSGPIARRVHVRWEAAYPRQARATGSARAAARRARPMPWARQTAARSSDTRTSSLTQASLEALAGRLAPSAYYLSNKIIRPKREGAMPESGADARVAIVTGGATGVGAATALASGAARLRRRDRLQPQRDRSRTTALRPARRGRATRSRCRATSRRMRRAAPQSRRRSTRFGRVDAWSTPPARRNSCRLSDLDGQKAEDFQKVYAVNVIGPVPDGARARRRICARAAPARS